MEKTFAMISLGCAKNLVNSEQMLYLLGEAGYTLVPEAEGADFAVVNTCGFIDAAKSEAIDAILEMAELKKAGKLGALKDVKMTWNGQFTKFITAEKTNTAGTGSAG